jgi:DNA-binding response OmpR family regulator
MAKILIAEDEQDIRDLITFTLRFAGYQVTATTDGEEAYQAAKDIMPDLILLDVRMPRLNGYDACKKIKTNDKMQHIPVVFLSAKGQEAEIQTGMDAGATEYIIKPFSPDQLTERVQAILKNHGHA